MILHAASIAAFFLDQLVQAPVVVQCVVPPSPDSVWKQWIPTAVSLLSVGIGLWIANRTIRNARELTEWSFRATSERDHERWVLDQKKAEWKEVLNAVNAGHADLIRVSVPEKQVDKSAQKEYEHALENLLTIDHVFGNRLFIDFAIMESLRIQWIAVSEAAKTAYNLEDKDAAASLWYVSFTKYVEEVRTIARKDLGINLS
jgi:hypothetical protein